MTETRTSVRRAAATALLVGAGVGGRVALQHVPSVSPGVAVAVAAGLYGGWRHGAATGAGVFMISNSLVWGGQGPWTVFQVLGAGAAGGLAGMLPRGRGGTVAALVGGTVAFEAVVNLGSALYMPWGLAALPAALPFAATHLAATLGFGGVLHGFDDYIAALYTEDERDTGPARARHPGGAGPGDAGPVRVPG